MDIFGTTQLASFSDDKPVRLTVDGLADEKLYLTSIRGDINPNFQLMYTIGRGTFLNSFEHRLSLFTIQGIYVLVDCNGPLDNVGEPPFMVFYKKHNINTSSKSVRITFNNIVITGFLVKLSLGNYQQEGKGDVDGHMFTLLFLGAIDGLNPPPQVSTGASVTQPSSSTATGLKSGFVDRSEDLRLYEAELDKMWKEGMDRESAYTKTQRDYVEKDQETESIHYGYEEGGFGF